MPNTQVRLARRPVGLPSDQTWEVTEEAVPEPGEGQFRLRTVYLSLDPAMRGWLNDAASYIPPVGIGEVMRAGVVGVVEASRAPDVPEGSYVVASTGVQEYAVTDTASGAYLVDPKVAPLPTYLGTLGMTGMTAYFGLLEVGALREGDTVLVSGAAGAVGMVVGQLAKIKNCRAVGIAGGPDKCRFVESLGFDACVDYKAPDFAQALRAATPDKVDVYFDNVGGDILDLALTRLNRGARVPICGAISQYNATEAVRGPANYLSLLVNRARMEGFIVFDFADRYGAAAAEMGQWLAAGKLVSKEDVVRGGVRDFPATLLRLFRGENVGKLVLAVGAE